jgi:phosphoglycolate phosphatase
VILVIFDMDGTLIDTEAMIAEHMAATFVGQGLHAPTPEQSRRVIGLSLPLALSRLAGSDDPALIKRLVDDYKRHYRASLVTSTDREGLFPGARAALDSLHARPEVILGIATGKGLAGVHRILQLHDIAGHFSTLQTPDNNPSKPHPGMIESAMRETGATKDRTIMIGDTTFDIEMGVAAGCHTIGVNWGYHDALELIGAGASTMIDTFDQLDGAIRLLTE